MSKLGHETDLDGSTKEAFFVIIFFSLVGVRSVVDTKELSLFCSGLNLALVITKLFYYLTPKSSKLLLNNDCVVFDYHKRSCNKEPFSLLIYNLRQYLNRIQSFHIIASEEHWINRPESESERVI